MEKLLYEEKNIGSARKIMIGICAGIFLLIGILIFWFDAQIPDISPATLWQPSWQPSTLWATASMC